MEKMFNFIKNKLSTIYSSFTAKVSTLFSRTTIDEETLKELEQLLLSADAGVTTTRAVLTRLRKSVQEGSIEHGQDLKKALEKLLIEHLEARNSLLKIRFSCLLVSMVVGKQHLLESWLISL